MSKDKKNKLKEFFKELGAGFFVAVFFVFLFLLGCCFLSFFPKNTVSDLPSEIIILLGFIVFLAFLHIVGTLIRVFRNLFKNNKRDE